MSGKKERKKKSFLVPKIHKRREFCLCSRVCALLMHFLVRCGLRESCGCESNDGIQAQEKGKGKGKGKKTLKISKRRVCVCAREQTNMCTFGFSSVCLFVRRHGPLSLSCEVIVNGARGHQLPHRHTPSLSPCGRCVSFPPFPCSFPHTHISTLCFVFLPLGPPLIDEWTINYVPSYSSFPLLQLFLRAMRGRSAGGPGSFGYSCSFSHTVLFNPFMSFILAHSNRGTNAQKGGTKDRDNKEWWQRRAKRKENKK